MFTKLKTSLVKNISGVKHSEFGIENNQYEFSIIRWSIQIHSIYWRQYIELWIAWPIHSSMVSCTDGDNDNDDDGDDDSIIIAKWIDNRL